MKIAIGSDHGGYNLKKAIIEHFKEKDLNYEDLGCYSADSKWIILTLLSPWRKSSKR